MTQIPSSLFVSLSPPLKHLCAAKVALWFGRCVDLILHVPKLERLDDVLLLQEEEAGIEASSSSSPTSSSPSSSSPNQTLRVDFLIDSLPRDCIVLILLYLSPFHLFLVQKHLQVHLQLLSSPISSSSSFSSSPSPSSSSQHHQDLLRTINNIWGCNLNSQPVRWDMNMNRYRIQHRRYLGTKTEEPFDLPTTLSYPEQYVSCSCSSSASFISLPSSPFSLSSWKNFSSSDTSFLSTTHSDVDWCSFFWEKHLQDTVDSLNEQVVLPHTSSSSPSSSLSSSSSSSTPFLSSLSGSSIDIKRDIALAPFCSFKPLGITDGVLDNRKIDEKSWTHSGILWTGFGFPRSAIPTLEWFCENFIGSCCSAIRLPNWACEFPALVVSSQTFFILLLLLLLPIFRCFLPLLFEGLTIGSEVTHLCRVEAHTNRRGRYSSPPLLFLLLPFCLSH
jgi:hypothetical protein